MSTTSMDDLARQQIATGEAITKIQTNYKKDGQSRKTRPYLESRMLRLDHEWGEFEKRDILLNSMKDQQPDHPYFTEKFYQQVQTTYEDMKSTLNKALEVMEKRDGTSDKAAGKTSTSHRTIPDEEIQIQEKLIRQQGAAITALERLLQSIETVIETPQTHAYYKQRLQTIGDHWTGIVVRHSEIMANAQLLDYDEERFLELEERKENTIIAIMEKLEPIRPHPPNAASTSGMKLPKITLPTFDGSYLKWTPFHDLFNQLIHKNPMSQSEKMFYLKAHLTGEASKLIQHLMVSDENYSTAWNILTTRYNNKRLLVSAFLQRLLSQSAISGESATAIKRLHDTTNECLSGIQNLGISTEGWDPILLYILQQKLDKESHRLYEQSLKSPREIQRLDHLLNFLESRFQTLESLGERKFKTESSSPKTLLIASNKPLCPICKRSGHLAHSCDRFLQLSPSERLQRTQRLLLCRNCLKPGHSPPTCPSGKCRKCNQLHHTLLHINQPTRGQNTAQPQATLPSTTMTLAASTQAQATNLAAHNVQSNLSKYVFLGTAIVHLLNKDGDPIECRALIDSGSQLHFISERLYKKLGLSSCPENVQIATLGNQTTNTRRRISVTLQSRITAYSTRLEAFVIPRIASIQPETYIDVNSWQIPKNISLADNKFNHPGNIDLLIGAELFCEMISIGQIRLGNNLPTLQNTTLGWIIIGKAENVYQQSRFCGINTYNNSLDKQLERFWSMEEADSPSNSLTTAEQRCERHFASTTKRNKEGRFIVKLPFALEPSNLGESKDIAIRRFLSLEKRLERNPQLKADYTDFMKELLQLNHMESIAFDQIPRVHYFLPHHCVLRPESSTTKLRVVFDGSCKTSNNNSLNDLLLVGPTIQDDLFSILVRFRLHKYVFTADITKMYRQILVNEQDRNFQLIVWRDNPSEELQCYRLRTVTYGTASAPYLATKCIQQLADEQKATFPLGAKVVKRDFYVDDLMTGSNDLKEALEMQLQLRQLLNKGGFPLRKWSANHPKLLENIPKDDCELKVDLSKDEEGQVKTLGLTWYPKADAFSVNTNLSEPKRITKRSILSDVAHVYDPLGLVNPAILLGKIFLQQLWLLKLDWDAAIPQELHTKWLNFREELRRLNSLSVPRHVCSKEVTVSIQLHAFSDASERAYGTAIYLRTTDKQANVSVHLLCAKSKVAPLKKTTLPRLELCAAQLMVKLVKRLKNHSHTTFNDIYYWTDSSITLSWINSESSSLQTFVANRVSYIQTETKAKQWRHISTKLNPADLVSRGLAPTQLLSSSLWFQGPSFLKEPPSKWPEEIITPVKLKEEMRTVKSALAAVTTTPHILATINHRNKFRTLHNIVGFVKRFVTNLKQNRSNRKGGDTLEPTELRDALLFIIKTIQMEAFMDDIKLLSKRGTVSSNSKLISLTPFLDEHGIIRVGGRLQAADLAYDAKHPMVLPHSNPIVKLLMKDLHERNMHAGPQALLAITRQQFWPLRGKELASSIVHQCLQCFRTKPRFLSQLMGNLPTERVQPARPFLNVGVDFCGPIHIHYKIKGKRPSKAYIAVFVCFSTRAVHLELASDLTKDAFIGVLKRFIGRRGKPSKIFCDNATNFVGAKNELQELRSLFSTAEFQKQIKQHCAEKFIEWRFIPPRSPHFGGLWEAAVKSAKYHLKRTLMSASLTYEELNTIIVEIEGILNSRPLTQLSNDPNDLQALTPAHFLIGEPLTTIANPSSSPQNHQLLRHWELVKSMRQAFWDRWSKEYLHQLQPRSKWNQGHDDIKIGSLVLIKEDNSSPLKWPLGRIIQKYHGSDERSRVFEIRTERGIIKRSINNLCPLPIENNEDTEDNSTKSDIKKSTSSNKEKEAEKGTFTSEPTSTALLTLTTRKDKSINHILPKTPKRRRILPINPSWLNNPEAMKPSPQLLKYKSPPELAESASNPKRARSTIEGGKFMKFNVMFTICLALFIPNCNGSIQVSPFDHNPAIYFEDMGQMSMVTDNWNIVVYYNLDNYWKEVFKLQSQIRRLKEVCNRSISTDRKQFCQTVTAQFQQELSTIEMNNEILLTRNGERIPRFKRAPLEIIGTIANRAFGILDQEYADYITATISKVKKNEDHLLHLIKNQTSLIDSTENIIRKNQEQTNSQLSLISSYLEELQKDIHETNKMTERLDSIQIFNLLSIHTSLIMNTYKGIQTTLIETITDCHHGKVNPLLITPEQLERELNVIRENIPPTLSIPGQSEGIFQLYSLMTAQARVTKENVIFNIKFPLISKDIFQIFHTVPIPFKAKEATFIIKTSSTYLAVNLHRDHYYNLSEEEIANCIRYTEGHSICNKKHTIFNKNAGNSQCELQILNQGGDLPTSCILQTITTPAPWTQLHDPNSWIFSFNQPHILNIVCGTKTYQRTIQKSGILRFNENCVIKDGLITISAHHKYVSKVDNSFTPSIRLNETQLEEHISNQHVPEKPHHLLIKNNTKEIQELRNAIRTLQTQEHLPEDITKATLPHSAVSYTTLGLLLVVIIGVILYKIFKPSSNILTHSTSSDGRPAPPRPALRRANFHLHQTS